MTKLATTKSWYKTVCKIKDTVLRERIAKQLEKIRNTPEIGKPMRCTRKGTREIYMAPFRISCAYFKEKDEILLLDLYHKDEQ
ncbi:hypothetical protein HY486_03715 [Candidatus Woesearchaeota archaeon]|nr:hypothetical protein [Candidatus Woesearchaeota archaeon]